LTNILWLDNITPIYMTKELKSPIEGMDLRTRVMLGFERKTGENPRVILTPENLAEQSARQQEALRGQLGLPHLDSTTERNFAIKPTKSK